MTEEEYVKNNETLLKLLNRKEAVSAFTLQQPEQHKINILKQEIEQLQTRLKSNDEQKNKLQRIINYQSDEQKKIENKQKQELQQVKQFCEKRDKMLASLPLSMRDIAAKQFQKLTQYQDEFNIKYTKPEEIFSSAGFVAKLIHGKKLKEFDAQFADIAKKAENGDIVTNFDMSASFEGIAKGINQKYEAQKEDLQSKIKERQSELNTVDNSIYNDKKTLQIKENDLAQSENSLNEKVNKFSTVYDTHPFIDTSYIDPVVQKALDIGQIHGEDRAKQVLASLLTKACQNSDIAKGVLYEALNKGTKYSASKQSSRAGGNYCCGVISVDAGFLSFLSPGNQEVEAMATLVHESRHACQDTGENVVRNNWANTFMESSIQEVDAYSIEAATVYQLNHQLGTNAYQENSGDGHEYMLKAFSKKYEQTKDMGKALGAAALEWDERFSNYYKTQYINQNWCHLQENAETVHPEEFVKRYNITYQGKPYIDIEKVTDQILTIHTSNYDVISQKLELSGKKDDSLQYFSIKTPGYKRDENGQIMKDELGLDEIEYKITPPTKKFIFSSQESDSNSQERKVSYQDMSTSQVAKFIQNRLRLGNNPFLEADIKSNITTKEKTVEKGKIINLPKINREMER